MLTLVACSSPKPARPLAPGYYVLDQSVIGVTRRIIIVPGERRASYDVWRVSQDGDGTVKHAHYDLIAQNAVPTSGRFDITQEGSDCGSLLIEPYRGNDPFMLTVRYGLLGIEHFGSLGEGDAPRYRAYDEALTRRMLQVASDRPKLYPSLSIVGKFFYAELNPRCTFD